MDSAPSDFASTTASGGDDETRIADELLTLIGDSVVEFGDDVTIDSDLFAEGLDSMGIMHLIVVVGEQFGVELSPADVTPEHFGSARKLARTVIANRSGGEQA